MSTAFRAEKSTNVRANGQLLMRVLARVAPAAAARRAEELFFTPPQSSPSRGDDVLRRGNLFTVEVDGCRVHAWSWGSGPAVLLLHGWGGRAGQLSSFVDPLVSAGYSVVALDAPGHGQSDDTPTSLLHFSQALRAVAARSGPVHAVIAHSLGGAACAHALRSGLQADRVVLIGSPADAPRYFTDFLSRVGIQGSLRARMIRDAEERLAFRWEDVSILEIAPSLDAPALVLHDHEDAEVPFIESAAIAALWPSSRLVGTSGLGHRRILRDPGVIATVLGFLAERADSVGEARHVELPRPSADREAQAQLDEELFDREARRARAFGR